MDYTYLKEQLNDREVMELHKQAEASIRMLLWGCGCWDGHMAFTW